MAKKSKSKQSWRSKVDWVAAGKKAFATRQLRVRRAKASRSAAKALRETKAAAPLVVERVPPTGRVKKVKTVVVEVVSPAPDSVTS